MRPGGCLAVGLAFAAALGAAEIPPHPRLLHFRESGFRPPPWEPARHQLSSGTPVYVVEDHTLPLVSVTVAVRAAAWLDPPDQDGLASLTGALVRRSGTESMSADELDRRADNLAVELDSLAGITRAGASLSAPTWSFSAGLDLFLEMLAQPGFEAERLAAARANLTESMRRRGDDPVALLEREWSWLLYGRRHFRSRVLTPATLDPLRREDLQRFHRRFWRPERMIVAVSGDVHRQQVLTALEAAFASWPAATAGEEAGGLQPAREPIPPARPGLYHAEYPSAQALVLLGHRTMAESDLPAADRFPFLVLEQILAGEGAVARLAGRLRTAEGQVYSVDAALDAGEIDAGELRVRFATAPDQVARAVTAAVDELLRVQREAPTELEVEVVKRGLATALRLRFDTAEEIAGYFAQDDLVGRPHDYWTSYLERLAAVTPADVLRVARRYLRPDELVVLVVGPWDRIGPGLEALARPGLVTRLPARDPLSLEVLPRSPGIRSRSGSRPGSGP